MIEPGLEQSAQETVTEEMTAAVIGSGDVPVLGTPAILSLVERLAVASLAERLDPGATSVGTRVELEHVAPTPVGALLSARCRLEAVDGRTLRFAFEVTDPAGPVARGTHRRVVVQRDEFVARASTRR
jgi:fluoroacetyl-CoA thioesterase